MRWIVAASRSEARFLQWGRGNTLKEIESLHCPEARSREREVLADAAGRSFDSHGEGSHRMAPRTTAHEQTGIRFAKRIADELESHRNANRFTELVLVAPADFLGILRKALSAACAQRVVDQHDKNIVALSAADISQRFANHKVC